MWSPSIYSQMSEDLQFTVGHASTVSVLLLLTFMVDPRFGYLSLLIAYVPEIGNHLRRSSYTSYYWSRNVGSSMMPSIPSGSTASVQTDFEKIEVGDVVSYQVPEYADYSNDMVIHHRVIGKLEDARYVLKGDGNDSVDGFVVHEENILCKTVQYGYQPLYIPLSPSSLVLTVSKICRKFGGQHAEMLKDAVETEMFLDNLYVVKKDGESKDTEDRSQEQKY